MPSYGDNMRLQLLLRVSASHPVSPLRASHSRVGFLLGFSAGLGFTSFQSGKSVITPPSVFLLLKCCCYHLLVQFSLLLFKKKTKKQKTTVLTVIFMAFQEKAGKCGLICHVSCYFLFPSSLNCNYPIFRSLSLWSCELQL